MSGWLGSIPDATSTSLQELTETAVDNPSDCQMDD